MRITSNLFFPFGNKANDKEIKLKKWKNYGFDTSIFQKHTQFAHYLFKTLLAGQIKITRDTLLEKDGEPSIKVEGNQLKFSDFLKRFEVKYNSVFCEKSTGQVYTYLDTGLGFVKHDPCHFEKLIPISKLTPEQYQRTIGLATQFKRPEEMQLSSYEATQRNQQRNHIIQVVCSAVFKGKRNFITRPFHNLFMAVKHPSLRIIDEEGKVYGVGFIRKHIPERSLKTIHGTLRSPDIWEYHNSTERVVTNIAVTKQEAGKLFCYIENLQKKAIEGHHLAFNAGFQNCTRFVNQSVKASTSITLEDSLTFAETIARITPLFIRKILIAAGCPFKHLRRCRVILPGSISKMLDVVARKVDFLYQLLVGMSLAALVYSLGGHKGGHGLKFDENECRDVLGPPLKGDWSFVGLSSCRFHVPSVLVEWQMKQPSTVVYKNPVKLAIAVP